MSNNKRGPITVRGLVRGLVLFVLAAVVLIYVNGLIVQFVGVVQEANATLFAPAEEQGSLFADFSFNPITVAKNAFKPFGLILLLVEAIAAIALIAKRSTGNKDARGFTTETEGTYGTAGWMSDKEMKEVLETGSIGEVTGTIFGRVIEGRQKNKIACMPTDTRLNRHIAVIGASGSMKSRAIIRPKLFQALKAGESVVVTDPKGELYTDTAELFRKAGYNVKVFNLTDPNHSDSWNVMAKLDPKALDAEIMSSIIMSNTSSGTKGDVFWENGEKNLLKALILYVATSVTVPDNERNIMTVYDQITAPQQKLDVLFSQLPKDNPALVPYELFLKANSSDKVSAGFLLGLGSRLAVLQNQALSSVLKYNDIDLTEPAKEKTIFYVVIPDSDSSLEFISSLFFSFLFLELKRYCDSQPNKKANVPVNILLDEFNNIGKIGASADGSAFAKELSVVRSRDIRIMLAVQSLGQLQNRYPKGLWSEILSNCDIQLCLRANEPDTADYFSKRSGEISLEVQSVSQSRGSRAISQNVNYSKGKRLLLTSDEVQRLPNDELLVVIAGHNILKLKKVDYTEHPYAKDITPVQLTDYYHERPVEVKTVAPPKRRSEEAEGEALRIAGAKKAAEKSQKMSDKSKAANTKKASPAKAKKEPAPEVTPEGLTDEKPDVPVEIAEPAESVCVTEDSQLTRDDTPVIPDDISDGQQTDTEPVFDTGSSAILKALLAATVEDATPETEPKQQTDTVPFPEVDDLLPPASILPDEILEVGEQLDMSGLIITQ